MNSQKRFKNTESQNLTINEMAQEHFLIHRAVKTCKNIMNENHVKGKLFAPFLRCTR
jgi:ribosomal protein L35